MICHICFSCVLFVFYCSNNNNLKTYIVPKPSETHGQMLIKVKGLDSLEISVQCEGCHQMDRTFNVAQSVLPTTEHEDTIQ